MATFLQLNILLRMIIDPLFIPGGTHVDGRGSISFVNNFKLDEVTRLYHIENKDINVVRAWQGHQLEQKWFYVVEGEFKIVLLKLDDWIEESKLTERFEYSIKAFEGVLHVPGGYVNGFKALSPNSKMMVFSNFTVEESVNDDYRFNNKEWFNWD